MKRISLFFAVLVISLSSIATAAFLPGDILLQSADCGEFCEAIRIASNAPVDHAALVVASPMIKNVRFNSRSMVPSGEVIEAWTPIVKRTSLKTFFSRGDGNYIQLRLKSQYRTPEAIKAALAEAASYLGREYDYMFEEDEKKLYCSELVHKAYSIGAKIPIGLMVKADTFDKNLAKGYWTEHFNGKIPWQRKIIIPIALIYSDKFDIIHSTYPGIPAS